MVRNIEHLERQAKQIRRLIIRSIGKAGFGHPGGLLSCADLTAALYFDVMNIKPEEPLWEDRDRFVLSKGRACPALYAALATKGYYPMEKLDHLRELGSILQGHPYPGKTPGVNVSAGSPGQGLSVTNGIALGARLDGKDYYVYCLMGDGKTEEGQVWEAAMSTVHYRLDHVIAFVDYNRPQIDGIIEEIIGSANVAGRFEALGWNVLTIDGHKIEEILQAIGSAKETKGIPTMIVMNIVKGKGVSFMENQVGWHGSASSVDQVAQALKELGEQRMSELIVARDAFGQAIIEFAESNGKVVMLDADLAKATMSCKFKDAYPNRFFNMGVAECDLVGTAAGLSATGKTPFACTFAVFAAGRTFEQIRNSVAYPRLNVKIYGSHGGISVDKDGVTHQAVEDSAVMAAIPNMVVLNPGNAVEMRAAIKAMIGYDSPVYIRLGHNPVPMVFDPDTYCFQVGKGIKVREGKDVTLVATGSLLDIVNQVAGKPLAEGIQMEVINIATIKPLDKDLIVKSARKTQRVVVLEEGIIVDGLGSAVAHALSEQYPVPMRYIGMDDCFGQSGDSAALMEYYDMTTEETVRKAKKLL